VAQECSFVRLHCIAAEFGIYHTFLPAIEIVVPRPNRGGCCRRRVLIPPSSCSPRTHSERSSSQWPEGTLAVVPDDRLDARVLGESILAELASDAALLEAAEGDIRVQEPGKR
jgi:hypothetical protein